MGAERRKDPRVSCFLASEVRRGSQVVAGTVRNLSAGGLSLHVDLAVEQGEVLHLSLQPDRRKRIEVEAIVWHVQAMRERKTGRTLRRLGLVLSEANDDYADLLDSSSSPKSPSGRTRRAFAGSPAADSPPPGPQSRPRDSAKPKRRATAPPKPVKHRIRVKQDLSPRTRTILVFAPDREAARAAAQTEIDPGWHILEVERA